MTTQEIHDLENKYNTSAADWGKIIPPDLTPEMQEELSNIRRLHAHPEKLRLIWNIKLHLALLPGGRPLLKDVVGKRSRKNPLVVV